MDARRIGPVVVGVDGSANSRRALVLAGRHARSTGAELTVVHAVGLTEEIDGREIGSTCPGPVINATFTMPPVF